MKKIKEYFSNKTGEQIFSLCLLIGVVALMLFCAIIRLCGALWFKANINIEEPSKVIQEIVKGALLIFELMARCNELRLSRENTELCIEFFIFKTKQSIIADRLCIDEKSVTMKKLRLKQKLNNN